ncbi:outer membrane beta-barrel protein [Flavobacterium sp. JP2137]|uniref:outer membrane beta-barrel protein n=1 Tax=Flavobacterium sp. JP2137 TaxID=3414510 RepID=UPI003D2FF082
MKKTLLLFCLLGFFQAKAQVGFSPGIRAGANFSSLSHVDSNTRTDFYVGLVGAVKLAPFYTLQPELNYSRQGANDIHYRNYDWIPPVGREQEYGQRMTGNLAYQYMGVSIINKFHIKNFNLQVGPGLDVMVQAPEYITNEVDLTLNLGVGYKLTESLGIEARLKVGMIDPFNDYFVDFDDNHEYITNNVFQVGLFYKFK